MSERDADLLRHAFELWNGHDIEGALEYAAEDVRWYPGGIFPDFDELYEGRDRVREFWTLFMEPWEWIKIEILELGEVGNELVLSVRFRAKSHEGVDVDIRLGQRYELEGGLLRKFHGYASVEQALEAARSEQGLDR